MEAQSHPLTAEIITIGHEVLSGHTVNTNASAIAVILDEVGIQVCWVTTVGDVEEHMEAAFRQAWERADVIVTTGGLGPTHDDITRTLFCHVFGRELKLHEGVLKQLEEFFVFRGRTLSERNRDQALVPTNTEPLRNQWGTAPGVYMNEDGRHWFMLPGVPREMHRPHGARGRASSGEAHRGAAYHPAGATRHRLARVVSDGHDRRHTRSGGGSVAARHSGAGEPAHQHRPSDRSRGACRGEPAGGGFAGAAGRQHLRRG